MRFYTQSRPYYCGIDLHTRWMYICILSQTGEIVYHKNHPVGEESFLAAIAAFREDLVVGVGCTFTWYWLADLCAREGIEFVLGHALYMGAISRKTNRGGIAEAFPETAVQESIRVDLELIDHLDVVIENLNALIERTARVHDPQALMLLRTIHGTGKILALVILYEIHTIERFDTVQQFCSYARLATSKHESAGKTSGRSRRNIGNKHLKWAFSEASALFLRGNPEGMKYKKRLEKKHGKAKAMAILSHRLGRAVYYMLKRGRAFDMQTFLAT